ncbi:uncharacterized protein LOC117214918 [Bombus bifarius]|uniref:Uncharacterized protein LOC117213464 n=1 Tax=Bombus bifarius TaxID=103933 RepID=A0A6P8NJM4_9HYME|nr:uncharacterized protein LOC117213464 [Bombus bifarius]XP_033317173.1 uncharacterized protein LOC117214918 [Bombus bifarius]
MANPREDSFDAHNPTPSANPTSEVGSERLRALEGQVAVMNNLIHTLMQRPNTGTTKLPHFNPEVAGADPAAWCAAVSRAMKNNPLRDDALHSALSDSLQGSAAHWLARMTGDGEVTWSTVKERFLIHFGGRETTSSSLIKVSREPRGVGESTGAFAGHVRSLLQTRWQHSTLDEILNAVTLYILIPHDQRLKRLALTSDIRTEDQFLSEMRPFCYEEESTFSPRDAPAEPEAKRRKLSGHQTRCHYCGTLGHRIKDCRKRMQNEQQRDARRQEGSRPAAPSKAVCHRCHAEGHIAPNCPARRDGRPGPKDERKVNSCVVESPAGSLSHLGESFPFYFDSGAERSLIRESVAPKFSGRRTTDIVVMRGIGNTCVKSTSQILSTVRINCFTLEITFHVLADSHLHYDIMIGREILSQGFDVTITRNSVDICKTKTINACSKTSEDEININAVDTDVVGNDKSRLISVLEKFKNSFITGFPRTRVSTGQLEIRLIDPNVTVQRSPYRLSEEERRIVRERIDELIRAKIVRPSNSPFASPILLVKKKDGSDRLCVDFRALNKNTVANQYSLPLIADQIARLQKARYFISLDMASGFHQIPIHPNSTEYTAFVTPDGQYEYVTMPFGLKNAPSVFQRAILNALDDLAYSFVVVYLDDVLIIADSVDQALERHEQIRQKVISVLTDAPVLMIFDPNYPIELHTNASSEGYGAILMHRVEGKNRVVEYYSKRTSPAESRYHSYELETLAVVNAVKHFRHYLHGREFLVVTDCNSLKASSYKKPPGGPGKTRSGNYNWPSIVPPTA